MHQWRQTLTSDFAKFWTGQTISSFGSAFTSFALPSLVRRDDLVVANGRIQASYSAAAIAGPALAGVLATWLTVPALLSFASTIFSLTCKLSLTYNSKSEHLFTLKSDRNGFD
jgi:hypothetical protein